MKKPWAGRFKEKTDQRVEAFTESVSFDWRLWPHDIEGSVAHARMLAKQGIIAEDEAEKILAGLSAIARELEEGTFRFRPELEDIHMNIEAALVKKVGPVGGKLHTARSRNDQVALDLRLYLRAQCVDILGLVAGLTAVLLEQAEKNMGLILPGYTHLQRAQPVLRSHHLLAYAQMLQRDRERLKETLKRINVLPLGAGALAGTSLPIDRRYVARLLQMRAVVANSIDAVSDRDFALEFLFTACTLMMHLSRLSEELVLWCTEEFGFLRLPDSFATGSSIMPQKKNPDVPELVRGKTGRVYGNLMSLLTVMKGLPLAYDRDLQEDKPPVFDTVDTLKGSLTVLAGMLTEVRFDASRMYEAAARSFATATDLAEYLVRKGLPFREAHEVAGRLVAHCISRGKELRELGPAELRRFSGLLEEDVLPLLTVESSVNARRSLGGTAPREVKRQIRALRAALRR
ncbi:MAG: argininosuccinate lyase [Nitrospirota bacterium]